MLDDTIYALTTGGGRSAVAVLRVSGAIAGDILSAITDRPLPAPRRAVRRFLRDPVSAEAIDEALVLWFPAPASFTGEDVAELHVHGGRAVIEAIGRVLAGLGARPAEAGEFTRRAFHAGKLDLTQAEAIADLVAAETEAQRRQALRQMAGDLGRIYDGWRERLVTLSARAEAAIDFPEEDLPPGLLSEVSAGAAALAGEMAAHLADGRRGERLRDGLHVAILGAPNAGKSSLLNALVGRGAAIVHPAAGTTRDVIEVALDIGGWPVVLADTAGLREAEGPVEAEGVRRARERAAGADLKLLVFDASHPPDAETTALVDADAIVVLNKADLVASEATFPAAAVTCLASALSGAGIANLARAIGDQAAA
ncbi:MAG: tRNA uridine-5-carboxymethylaminomethyl(34) synthesis GTPase MnmE, partial [Alphaproteobacteria bacterium]|nr:tRNA uridine-5-carboxymethylaminomethyl(34) synthesis GTPase MnmE [Alphaproteobacteria bacterium]